MMPPKRRKLVSDHFATAEFDCHDGTPVPLQSIHGLELAVAWWLEPMRERFGPVTILSGFRTQAFNATLPGAVPNSFHRYDLDRAIVNHDGARIRPVAFDVRCRRGDVRDWSVWAHSFVQRSATLARKGRGGIGYYPSSGFVHLDTGPRRSWQG